MLYYPVDVAKLKPREVDMFKTILIVGLLVIIVAPSLEAETVKDMNHAADEVRAVEEAFAATMVDRDLAAFSRFLSPEAVFFSDHGPLRGISAVVGEWKAYFEGPDAPFSWRPEEVEVLESGLLAFSSGPVFDPENRLIGTFNSVWRKEDDGQWRIVFDKGCPASE